MATSDDGGRTFSFPRRLDSSTYPGGDASLGVAHGVLAASYQSGSDAVFETSTDGGEHWLQHVAPASGTLAADPAHLGHYAVLADTGIISVGTAVDVYTTSDSGLSWTGPIAINGPLVSGEFVKPWIAFSSTGMLGAVWRSQYSDNSFDVWAAMSADGGSHFSRPLKLTSTPSPPDSPIYGDDTSVVAFGYGPTAGCVYVGWGDGHDQGSTGAWDTWLSSMPLSAYGAVSDDGAVLQGSCAAHPGQQLG